MRDLLRQARCALAARGITPRAKRAATRDEVLGPMLDALSDDARGVRDRAILAVAFASGGRRRSELVALRLADVTAAGRDFTLRIRRSKTDQQGAGTDVPVKRAAADALRRWLRLLADQGISDGRDGIPLDLLMQLSGHKSHRIAARYFQTGAVHQNPAADLL
ncbi:tyrosine-type recombinase/integrase (plasmid) [Azospirillum sp. A29]|uniref:tyrosine-type recombinase/integrase n=1 Tax=Azospirillum sp. A29 TaxID=3160606 RepID=UPI003671D5FF